MPNYHRSLIKTVTLSLSHDNTTAFMLLRGCYYNNKVHKNGMPFSFYLNVTVNDLYSSKLKRLVFYREQT